MRLLLVTDAWYPQVNGVVRTLDTMCERLRQRGHTVGRISPEQFATWPCPTYPEVRLALRPRARIRRIITSFRPGAVHIATEGPLGVAARNACVAAGIPFSTSFHTRFPEYLNARFHIPVAWTYRFMRWIHAPSRSVMVATRGIADELESRGFTRIRRWTRGVDCTLFRPGPATEYRDLERPVFLFTGRVATEKNLRAFLALDLPGSKVVVGDGPDRSLLGAEFPEVRFAGAQHGEALARHYASADVFVFPSLTDTFGLVLLEALASGLPVAAFPVPGPADVLGAHHGVSGVGHLDQDLRAAALAALEIPRERCRQFALAWDWEHSVDQFVANLAPFDPEVVFGAPTGGVDEVAVPP
jgi:glycosyltransferase involved in cell wall biosynthesis